MRRVVPLFILATSLAMAGCSSSENTPELLEDDIQAAVGIPDDAEALTESPGVDNNPNNAVGPPNDSAQPVPGGNPEASTVPVVRNHTIVFPDDDLYQVQRATDFRSLCEGGGYCSVAAGQYNVINLDTGERYGPLTVSGADSPTPAAGLPPVEYIQVGIYRPKFCLGETAPRVEMAWQRIRSASGGAVEYTISLDGQALIVTAESSASFMMSDFSANVLNNPGPYRFSVSAATVNEPAAPALMIDVPYPAGDSTGSTTPTGRPVENRTTHGFGFWDNMSIDQQCAWPTDCLFTTDQWGDENSLPGICYSPNQRELIYPPNFRFALPGDNSSNHIEAIDWAGGNGMLIIADIAEYFGKSAYELSYFEQSGRFSGTFPILQSVTNIGSSSPSGINLDGKDIREVRGLQDSNQCPQATSIYVIGEYYERRPQFNAATLEGWINVGAFAAKIDARTGHQRALKYYPGRKQESLSFSVLPGSESC